MANTTRTKPGEAPVMTEADGTESLRKIQSSFEKNQKGIIGVVVAVVVLVGGYFGYKNFVEAPKEEKAASALFSAERWFELDSLNYTLNGDGQHPGALTVIKKYDGTKAANLARYYAGMSYLRTGDAKNAIAQLEKFDGKGTPFQYLAYGGLGDAYMETNNAAKGIEMYKKAAANEKDNFITPLYLFRAALANERSGKTDEAKKMYLELKNKYPYSMQARDIDKYLARVGELTID
jgi:predicted negative regulator of RcsB-dependent stress response